ncbi:MAG: hypothetical protein Q9209_003777 [Squamulea sp. 1 TL-2023]
MPTLGRYLSTIFDGESNAGRFRFGQNPKLDRSRTNVILVYRGSFNPPHRGHLAVLWHAYHQLTQDLNIIAAIIRPSHDDRLRSKYRNLESKPFAIALSDRARLWKEDPHFPPWAWVFTEFLSDTGGCSALKRKLKALAKKDACRIRFADLCGPDCTPEVISNDMTIITDIAREANYDQEGVLRDFYDHGFGPWSVSEEQQLALQNKMTQQASDSNADLGAETPTTDLCTQLAQLNSPKVVNICWQRNENSLRSLRFLRSTAEQHTAFRDISSSAIHETIHQYQGEEAGLRLLLRSVALSPDLLCDILLSPPRDELPDKEESTSMICNVDEQEETDMHDQGETLDSVHLVSIPIDVPPAVAAISDTTAPAVPENDNAGDLGVRKLRNGQRICYKCSSGGLETTCKQCIDWKLD